MSTNRSTLHRLFRLILLCAGLGFAIKAFLLAPLYVRFAADVAFRDSWWVNILYFLTDGGLIDLAVFAVCYPATLYAVRTEGLKKALRLPILFSLLTLLKFLINFVMTSITDGALPDMEEFLTVDLPMIFGMFAVELAQYLFVILIALFVRWCYDARIRTAEAMKLLPRSQQVDYPLPPPDFPFVGLYARRNALQRGALLTALLVFIGRFIMHLVYQITLFVQFGSSDGWVIMLTDLLVDLCVGVIFYFVSLLLMMQFHRKESDVQ